MNLKSLTTQGAMSNKKKITVMKGSGRACIVAVVAPQVTLRTRTQIIEGQQTSLTHLIHLTQSWNTSSLDRNRYLFSYRNGSRVTRVNAHFYTQSSEPPSILSLNLLTHFRTRLVHWFQLSSSRNMHSMYSQLKRGQMHNAGGRMLVFCKSIRYYKRTGKKAQKTYSGIW